MNDYADSRGLAVSGNDPDAVDACLAGIEGYNHWRLDTMGHLDGAIAADAGFALPRIVKAWILHMGRSDSFTAKVHELIAEADGCIDPSNGREVTLLNALKTAARGDGIGAGTLLEAHLEHHPTDLLAHRLVQFELFWNGRASWMRDIIERAAPHWSTAIEGFHQFLSCRAFSNEEAGHYEAAESYGRRAVEMQPADVWGTHAVAHVLVMQGRITDGVEWLESLCGNWQAANQLKHHLWWHLCLFLLEKHEHARILELLASEIRNPESPLVKALPDATIDLQNVASLLMRLELRGIDVGDRWQLIADICEGRITNHANAFSNAHDMMVLAASGRFEQAQALLDSMREYLQGESAQSGNLAGSYRSAGLALCQGLLAHRKGQYAEVVDALAPIRHDLPRIGGSHAQRDLFYQVLIDAAYRLGRTDLVNLFLHDVRRIGFDRVTDRTLYRDVVRAA